MNRIWPVIGLASAAALAACAPVRAPDLGRADPRATCSIVTASATTAGEAAARRYALSSLQYELRDLKGDFVNARFKGLRVTGRAVTCQAYALTGSGSGVYTCQAAARLCGR